MAQVIIINPGQAPRVVDVPPGGVVPVERGAHVGVLRPDGRVDTVVRLGPPLGMEEGS